MVDDICKQFLATAIIREEEKRYVEALVCYQQGIEKLLIHIKELPDSERKTKLRRQCASYMEQAEAIKRLIEDQKKKNSYHEQRRIEPDSCGYSYATVFSPFLTEDISDVEIDDAYIRIPHQIQNLVIFCELLVKKCRPCLQRIRLRTGQDEGEEQIRKQRQHLNMLKSSLEQMNIRLDIEFSSTLHDREIRCSNGWIFKIGRGLDYFKRPASRFAVGAFDMDLRPCHATTIDIFHQSAMRSS